MRPSRATGGGWVGRGVRQRRRIANGDGNGVPGLATEVPRLGEIAGGGMGRRSLGGGVSEAGQGRAARR